MIGGALLGVADFFFRTTSSTFRFDPDSSATKKHSHRKGQNDHKINVSELKDAGPSCIVAALRDFSFPETLALLFGLSEDAKHCILDALIEHHELRNALDFALHFEDTEKLHYSPYDQSDIAARFMDRIRAAKAANPSSMKKPVDSNPQASQAHLFGQHKIINVLTATQLALVTGISSQLANRIISIRRGSPFNSLEEIASRCGNEISESEMEFLRRLF